MSKTQKSFEEFFYLPKEDVYNIRIVKEYADKHDGDISPYRGAMRCPECRSAALLFVPETSMRRAYLRATKLEAHLENCSFNYEYASRRSIKEYVDSLPYHQVQDKLNSMMNMLCKTNVEKKEDSNTLNTVKKVENHPMLIPEKKRETTSLKALRRKSLAGWIDKTDGTDLYTFYGKVKLSVEEKRKSDNEEKEYSYYLLKLRTKNKKGEWKYRTSIYRGGKKDDIDEEKVYHIVLIGNLNFKYRWWKIDLVHRNALKFREVQ